VVSPSDWMKGIALSVTASVIGGASKLAIRKSWVMMDGILNSNKKIARRRKRHRRDGSLEDLFPPQAQAAQDEKFKVGKEEEEEVEMKTYSPPLSTPTPTPTPTKESEVLPITSNNLHTSEDYRSTTTSNSRALRYCGMFGMTVLNPICCVWAMQYASPSILAPFSGLTLVWIVLFSESIVGERPTLLQMIAASLIVTGEVIVAISGDHTNDGGVALEDLYQAYKNPFFIAFLIAMAIWMTLLCYFKNTSGTSPKLRRFAWGVSGGSITGLQNFLKDWLTTIKILSDPSSSISLGLNSTTMLLLIMATCAIASSLSGLLLLTACMKRYDATYSSSMFVGSFVISASIMAAVRYHTFSNLETVWNWIFYLLGLSVLLGGIAILATQEHKEHHSSDDEDEGHDEHDDTRYGTVL